MPTATSELQQLVDAHSAPMRTLTQAVEQVVVGQAPMITGLLTGLLTGGHVLLEGVPGLAKTLTVSTLAKGLHADFSRIQFTPDLLPADVVGTLIYSPKDGTFSPKKGPIFANIVLADEINRAPAKVQSALLEAMQERAVTIGDTTHRLDDPFLVLATQNPIEQEGTYPLPEAQVDRFMLKLRVGYPSKDEERRIVDRMAASAPPIDIEPVVTLDEVRQCRSIVDRVHLDERLRDYIIEIVHATREPKEHALKIGRLIEFGASPRASIALAQASRARAFLDGRAFVTPTDIKNVAPDVLRHRVVVSYEAEAEDVTSEDVVRTILDNIPTP
ncbi:MAG: MoxR family ATPase [Phycisphaerales bacterium]